MQPAALVGRILLVCGALWAGGCAQEGPLSIDAKIATRQANELFPRGTPSSRATRLLQEKGFQLARLDPDPAADHLLIGTCTRRKHTWLVGLVIINGRVAACSVTITEEP